MEKILYICRRYGVSMDSLFDEEAPAGDPPAEETAQPPAPQSLGRALGSFVENLSPANRWAGIGSLVGMTALLGLCALYLKGGGSGKMTEMTILWTGAIIVFGVVEALTAGLVSIWFVPGAVAGLIAAMAGLSVLAQLVLFLAVSAAALAATRPLVRKISAAKAVPTNADRVLGQTGRVTEAVDNDSARGAVYVDGKTWSARSAEGDVIPAGSRVEIVKMEGVKLFVRNCPKTCVENEEAE